MPTHGDPDGTKTSYFPQGLLGLNPKSPPPRPP